MTTDRDAAAVDYATEHRRDAGTPFTMQSAAFRAGWDAAMEQEPQPLKWQDHGCGIWTATSEALGMTLYQICYDAEGVYSVEWFDDEQPDTHFFDLPKAKLACEEDYKRRLSAAFQPPVSTGEGA